MAKLTTGKIEVIVEQTGPDAELIDRITGQLARHKVLAAFLGKARYRIMEVYFPDAPRKLAKYSPASAKSDFVAVIYDDTNSRTIEVTGTLARPGSWRIAESARQPAVTTEEFAEAVKILQSHGEFSGPLAAGELVAAHPMPPLLLQDLEDGRFRRFIGVQLLARGGGETREILGVNLLGRDLLRFPGRVPPGSAPGNFSTCGAPLDANQQSTGKGTPGSVHVTISSGGKKIWDFVAVRPSASSGTNGSGVELRFVNLRGKRMLYRAHVPMLNVKYDGDKCGPYRDWQYQEGQLQGNGTQVGSSGFFVCQSPAKTIMDSGSDTGTILGTAIYIDRQEVVLVCEMEAGWYRYVSKWIFNVDGTLKPRFGFAAVQNSCVCNIHHHHVYWRLDFDILTIRGNRIEEFNDPPIVSGSPWHQKTFEIRRPRDPAHQRKWRVTNIAKKCGVEVVPGADDGLSTQMPDTPFGRGDTWMLRYHGAEIDDGSVAIGPPYEVGLDRWVNGEKLDGEDVVLWYAGHFTHNLRESDAAQHGHIVGPDILPFNWS